VAICLPPKESIRMEGQHIDFEPKHIDLSELGASRSIASSLGAP
jgi:hypothetical protein